MMLIRLPDELFNGVAEISQKLGKSTGDYLTELLEQAVKAHELGCSLKDAVDLYERTVKERKTPEELARSQNWYWVVTVRILVWRKAVS